MRTWMKVACCVVAMFCVGQAGDTFAPVVVLDQQNPVGGRVNGCLLVAPPAARYTELQQSLSIRTDGVLSAIEITTCKGVPLTVGVSRAEPWVDVTDPTIDVVTWDIQTKDSVGDGCYNGYVWVLIDLANLGWQMHAGDRFTLHVWPHESTCLGFTYCLDPDHPGGEMWYSRGKQGEGGFIYGCCPADMAVRVLVEAL